MSEIVHNGDDEDNESINDANGDEVDIGDEVDLGEQLNDSKQKRKTTAFNHLNTFMKGSNEYPYQQYPKNIPASFVVKNMEKFANYLTLIAKVLHLQSVTNYMSQVKTTILEDKVDSSASEPATVMAYFSSTKFQRVINHVIKAYFETAVLAGTNTSDEAPAILPNNEVVA